MYLFSLCVFGTLSFFRIVSFYEIICFVEIVWLFCVYSAFLGRLGGGKYLMVY